MQRTVIYRGKYPHRIESVWSVRNCAGQTEMRVRTNDGRIYVVTPREGRREMPKLGEDVHLHNAQFVMQSELRRAAV